MGKAKEIELLANATANGIRRVAEAIRKPGGSQAVKMRIVEQFIDEFGRIIAYSKVNVVPSQLANIKGFFEGLEQVSTGLADSGNAGLSAQQMPDSTPPARPPQRKLPGTRPSQS